MFYPLPTLDYTLHKSQGADTYVVLDLHQAYQQLPVSEDSQKVMSITRQCGYTR